MEPLIKEVIARREFVKREAAKWHADGLIDDGQLEAIRATQSGHESEPPFSDAPVLYFELHEVVAAWTLFGEPVTVVSGMGVGITDNRPQLYPARLAWLSETGVSDPDARALVLELWAVLDAEKLKCVSERVRKQMAKD